MIAIDWQALFFAVKSILAAVALLYYVPYLMKRGYETGRIQAHWHAQNAIERAIEQGRQAGIKQENERWTGVSKE